MSLVILSILIIGIIVTIIGLKEDTMKIHDFCKLVALREGMKKEVDIAQIKEIVRIIREILQEYGEIDIYKVIHKL